MMADRLTAWISTLRLHTLPLAITVTGMGCLCAYADGFFSLPITLFTILTAILLQILSNFANDYGDYIHGADTTDRIGPKRGLQSGLITRIQLMRAIKIIVFLSLLSGIFLLWISFKDDNLSLFFLFLLIGIAAIFSALAYTATRKPYGYKGFGDLFVFIFFGPVASIGAYFLQAKALSYNVILFGLSMGLYTTAVLNLNNIRDIETDKTSGKMTIPVKIGTKWAKIYHAFLISSATLLFVIASFHILPQKQESLAVLPVAIFVIHLWDFLITKDNKAYYPLLKKLSFSIIVSALFILFGLLDIFKMNF